jgi:CRP-like cAMP-binding protein
MMEYTDVKQILANCTDLGGLEDAQLATLFWLALEMRLGPGTAIYVQGTPSDDSFCLLLSGDLAVERAGAVVGQVAAQQIFGEMAYFTSARERTATVRVGAHPAVVLKFPLNRDDLSKGFSSLRKHLGRLAWDRFVSDSQS